MCFKSEQGNFGSVPDEQILIILKKPQKIYYFSCMHFQITERFDGFMTHKIRFVSFNRSN